MTSPRFSDEAAEIMKVFPEGCIDTFRLNPIDCGVKVGSAAFVVDFVVLVAFAVDAAVPILRRRMYRNSVKYGHKVVVTTYVYR